MDEADIAIRNLTYQLFVSTGRTPTIDDVAMVAATTPGEIEGAWQRLSDAHALVLHGGTTQLRMLNPFSNVETTYRVQAGGRWWYANCAWDAFGICAALHVDGHIETVCLDCGQGIEVNVRDGRADDQSLVFNCLVPAVQWWDDIVFT